MFTQLLKSTKISSLLAGLLLVFSSAIQAQPTIHLGILDWNNQEQPNWAFNSWEPTLQALEKLPYLIKVSYFNLDQLTTALAQHQLDYVITNPGHYVELSQAFQLAPLATLANPNFNQEHQVVGSVLLVSAQRSDLNTWQDLNNQRLGAVSLDAFGGFQLIWDEFKQNGLDPWLDVQTWHLTGYPMQQLFDLLKTGEIDGLVARSCFAEFLAQQGHIKLTDFKAIGTQKFSDYPCMVSSQLYPNWPFLATSKPSAEQKIAVLQTLLTGTEQHPAQWGAALSYQKVYELFQRLRIGPFAAVSNNHLIQLAHQYSWFLLAATLVLLSLIFHLIRTSYLIKKRSQAIVELMQASQLQQQELEHLARFALAGELATGLAHEINQPLTAILNFAQGSQRLLAQTPLTAKQQESLVVANQKIATQSQRAAEIIRNLRAFIRKGATAVTSCDPALLVTEAAKLMEANLNKQQVKIKIQLENDLPNITANRVELLQILINLLSNALDAMQQQNSGTIYLSVYTYLPEHLIIFEVQDEGSGLKELTSQEVFNPFFTTKPQGLGLGLSLSKSLAASAGAQLSLETNSQGACARLEWPLDKPTN